MAHPTVAKIDENNIVSNIIVLDELETDLLTLQKAEDIAGSGTYKLIKYYDKKPSVFSIYVPAIDKFSSPKPYESWTLNYSTAEWEPPVAYPEGYDESIPTHVWIEDEEQWFQWDSENKTIIV
tara:strand:- start:227 stop:595 length:369 start_codon:yes stop_codon:yes gene_type:complete